MLFSPLHKPSGLNPNPLLYILTPSHPASLPPYRMVQTQEQYVFIYQALREELQELLVALASGPGQASTPLGV